LGYYPVVVVYAEKFLPRSPAYARRPTGYRKTFLPVFLENETQKFPASGLAKSFYRIP
jgi:hypothetical protein